MKKFLVLLVLGFSVAAQAKQSMDSVREDLQFLIPATEVACHEQLALITVETTCDSLRQTLEICHATAIDQDGKPIDVAEVTECVGEK